MILTEGERDVLAGDLEHAPSCTFSLGSVSWFRDDDGKDWTDETCTVPFVHVDCTCGYFALLERAQAKLRELRPREEISV